MTTKELEERTRPQFEECTDSEAIRLLIKVAKAWLTCNPWRAGELDSKTVAEAVSHLESVSDEIEGYPEIRSHCDEFGHDYIWFDAATQTGNCKRCGKVVHEH